ncbi:hypothetical protein [Brevibacillus reuszeri]|uniref:hypothetical protein n=1 Tax=Brevibacillus reuszeri TaxID=54915 RepID=UPI0013E0BD5C|nr:hypothetical protein [Brevibacillus reuszeri]
MKSMEYTCSAREWEFSRLFSSVSGSDRGARRSPFVGCLTTILVWILLLAVYYVLAFLIPDFGDQFSWMKGVAITLGIIIGAFIFIRSILKSGTALVMPQTTDSIRYLILDDRGISMNFYNNENVGIMPFIAWEGITTIELDITKELRYYTGGKAYPARQEQRVATFNARYPDYPPEEAKDLYTDRFTLLIKKERSPLSHTIIQIPQSWLLNDHFHQLLRQLERHSGRRIQGYDKHVVQLVHRKEFENGH